MAIYLAGPVLQREDHERAHWREEVKRRLPHVTIYDPMEGDDRGRTGKSFQHIVENAKRCIDRCSVVLVNDLQSGFKTPMEVLYAWERGKHVVVVGRKGEMNPWLHYHSHKICQSLNEAIAYIEGLPDKETPGENPFDAGNDFTFALSQSPSLPHTEPLVCGGEDPLLPHLLANLDCAERTDMAIAFVLESGVELLEEHLRDLLDRGAHIRLLTGDYLGVTDPRALYRLLDLQEGARGQLDLRVFESAGTSFHPKAYVFYFKDPAPGGIAYVGSSNLSAQALGGGIEWNYRIVPAESRRGFQAVVDAFENLFKHPKSRPIDTDWIQEYQRWRKVPVVQAQSGITAEANQQQWKKPLPKEKPAESLIEEPPPPPEPHEIQRRALDALQRTRSEGNGAGLVVLATGLGKTWLAAFDSVRFGAERVLFVAHREEILRQSLKTFRRIRPEERLGIYSGSEKATHANVLFASIQTLGRMDHLHRFSADSFDYIIVDEFHHASARSYRKLIDYFQPRFLLGLTATPERTDGGDLLALCGESLVYRCDLLEGIRRGLLCPFHYYGVPDNVDYRNIPWRSGRFDAEALTQHLATKKRAQNALEQYRARAGQRTLAFCCSQLHADFMAAFFSASGIRAAAVHSGPHSAPRSSTLGQLTRGELDVVFAVDMFNEGIDLPNIDTVMMLRPTESRILWTQQFGRGLRVAPGKDRLRVIDYIGNHKTFLLKPQALLGVRHSAYELSRALDALQNGEFDLPPGCAVTYDLEAIDIIRALLKMPKEREPLRIWYEEFRERQGERPTAVEAFHEDYNPRSARKAYGSWHGFVAAMGDLSALERQVVEHPEAGEFLNDIEISAMNGPVMLVLNTMLGEDRFPGQISMDRLIEGFSRLLKRSAKLLSDVEIGFEDKKAIRLYLEQNILGHWTAGKTTRSRSYFSYADGLLETTFRIDEEIGPAFRDLTREIVDWRVAEYLQRPGPMPTDTNDIVCKVSHAGGRPILFLPDRRSNPHIPKGWTEVLIEGEPYEANFVKVAINVVRRKGASGNVLPEILRGWFGSHAGLPGTSFNVAIRRTGEGLVFEP